METEINTQALPPSEGGSPSEPPAIESGAAKHFDTFETHFFQQGDDVSALGGEDRYDDSYDGKEKRPLVSYRSLVVLSIGSSVVAIAACVALFRSNAPSVSPVVALVTPVRAAVAAPVIPTVKQPAPEPVALAAAAPEMAAVPPPSQKAPVGNAPAPASAPAAGVAVAAKAPEQAVPASAPEPKTDKPAKAAVPTGDDDAEKAVVAKAEPEPATTDEAKAQPQVAASAPLHEVAARERCRQSIRSKRAKEIAATCSEAFTEDSTNVDAAIAVAKVELDRGHFAQASTWSKKAIAVNPESAEAYVFEGGAEQNQGHGKAAKEAYLHYLRLAPSGRYATEIRSIVGSL